MWSENAVEDKDQTLYLSCDYEISNHGTSFHDWKHLLQILSSFVNRAKTREGKLDLAGFIVYTLRREFLAGHKRLNRKYHLDALIDSFTNDCSLKLLEIEKAIVDYEDDDQYELAPKAYAKFTGMLIEKLLGIPTDVELKTINKKNNYA